MALPLELSKDIVLQELAVADDLIKSNGWKITHPADGLFTAELVSPIDAQLYILECGYENYREWPIYFEFIDPQTHEKGTTHAYPADKNHIFHNKPCICLECNRKAYATIHKDWGGFENWQNVPINNVTGRLTSIGDMLQKIWFHISSRDLYTGRMA